MQGLDELDDAQGNYELMPYVFMAAVIACLGLIYCVYKKQRVKGLDETTARQYQARKTKLYKLAREAQERKERAKELAGRVDEFHDDLEPGPQSEQRPVAMTGAVSAIGVSSAASSHLAGGVEIPR